MKKILSIAVAIAAAIIIAVVTTSLVTKPKENPGTEQGPEKYSVTFVIDEDAENKPQDLSEVESGSKITEPTPAPTLEGYTFAGWYNEPVGGEKWDFGNKTVTEDVTLYAQWTENGETPPPPVQKYTVTFDLNKSGATGGPAPITNVESGSTVERPTEIPQATGFTFDDWYKAADGTAKWNFDTDVVTQNTTIYAHWTDNGVTPPAQEYTVTFDYNYENKGTYQTAQTVNGKVTAPAENPERTGYTFEGWYEETGCTNRFNFSTTITEAKTLYANWTKNAEAGQNVTVTFQTNGGSTVDAQTFTAGGTATKPSTDPTYGDNVFCGWYSDPDCTQEYDFEDPVNANITIYALWKHWVSKESVAVGSIITSAQSAIGSDGKLATEYQYNDHITFPVGMKPESGNMNTQGKSPITLTISGDGLYEIYIHGTGASSTDPSQLFIRNQNDGSAEALATSNSGGKNAVIEVSLKNIKAGTYYVFSEKSVRIDQFVIREFVPLDQSGNPGGEQGGGGQGGQEESTYTVTFDLNPGGTYKVVSKIQPTSTIDRPQPNPSRYGYEFDGWHTDPVNNSPWDFDNGQVTKSFTLYAHWKVDSSVETNPDVTELVTVKYIVNGSEYFTQRVEKGQKTTQPKDPSEDNKQFVGWYETDPATLFNFDTPIVEDTNLTAKFADLAALQVKVLSTGAYNESLYVTWEDNSPESAQVEYKAVGATDWIKVDAPLVRKDADGNARVDIVGLKAGNYDVKITTSANVTSELPGAIAVAAYDRSGYAHFNYTSGIGAYNDDGTLKDNALVIYVTEQNKNTVMDEVCAANDDLTMFNIPYSGHGTDLSSKTASGIGWWLNNNQYTANNAASSKDKTPSNTYDAANGSRLGFKMVSRPIAIRIIGKVTAPEGLTAYNSVECGGTPGDNGNMARMKNLKNITIEGIGDDAVISGWGLHFIAGTDAQNGQGTSFEVRNVTFFEYTEDAVGMEGQQSGSTITAGVERCWIHNNTFLPGHCANAAESDKKEGDGSCDFKRGQYLTVAYNWFEYCHKTNLVGSSDSSLQYNLTYHHNVWWQCGSRIPLTRQANVHFYNNYIYGDATETSTPYSWISKPGLSYVHSLRANCYIFSEANYYDGCKNVTDGKSGGEAKGWNNIYYSTFGTNTITDVTSREQTVSNSCAYNGTSYSKFDTDENLFYYDKANNVSRCLLDNAVTARQKDLMYSGANGHGSNSVDLQISMPDGALQIPDNGKLTITMGANQQGIIFNGANSGKYKGMGIIFTLSAEAALTITTTSTGDPAPDIISVDGIVYAHKFEGTLQIVLPAGTYIVASGQKDKETTITAMAFENTAASSQARIDAAKAAIEKLPEATGVQLSDAADIKAARTAYNSLTAAEKKTFDEQLVTKLTDCENKLSELQIQNVRDLIGAIGEVTAESYPEIEAAQNAYNALNAAQQAQLTAEKAILDQAVADFAQYAVHSLIDSITEWKGKVDGVTATDRAQVEALIKDGESLESLYDGLDNGEDGGTNEQERVTNYGDLTAGMATLAEYQNVFVFEDALDAFTSTTVTSADASKVAALKKAYEALTPEHQGALSSEKTQKYNDIIKSYTDLMSQSVAVSFVDGKPSNAIFEQVGEKKNAKGEKFFVHAANQEFASGAKFESTTDMKLTLTVKMELKLYFNIKSNQNIKIDNTLYNTAADGEDKYVVTITLDVGEHHITRGDGEIYLYYATLTPAA